MSNTEAHKIPSGPLHLDQYKNVLQLPDSVRWLSIFKIVCQWLRNDCDDSLRMNCIVPKFGSTPIESNQFIFVICDDDCDSPVVVYALCWMLWTYYDSWSSITTLQIYDLTPSTFTNLLDTGSLLGSQQQQPINSLKNHNVILHSAKKKASVQVKLGWTSSLIHNRQSLVCNMTCAENCCIPLFLFNASFLSIFSLLRVRSPAVMVQTSRNGGTTALTRWLGYRTDTSGNISYTLYIKQSGVKVRTWSIESIIKSIFKHINLIGALCLGSRLKLICYIQCLLQQILGGAPFFEIDAVDERYGAI